MVGASGGRVEGDVEEGEGGVGPGVQEVERRRRRSREGGSGRGMKGDEVVAVEVQCAHLPHPSADGECTPLRDGGAGGG